MNEVATLTARSMVKINSISTHMIIGLNTWRQDIADHGCLFTVRA